MRRPFVRLVVAVLITAIFFIVPAVAGGAPGPAPAFSLELFGGQTLKLADLKGTAVVLLFWTQW